MSMGDGLGFRERGNVGGFGGVQARHGGHDLPSFRPPEGKPYVLLVWFLIDEDYNGERRRRVVSNLRDLSLALWGAPAWLYISQPGPGYMSSTRIRPGSLRLVLQVVYLEVSLVVPTLGFFRPYRRLFFMGHADPNRPSGGPLAGPHQAHQDWAPEG